MKKLGLLALLLSIGVASVGCEPAKKKEGDKAKPATEAKTDATDAAAPDAKPADAPADPAPEAK